MPSRRCCSCHQLPQSSMCMCRRNALPVTRNFHLLQTASFPNSPLVSKDTDNPCAITPARICPRVIACKHMYMRWLPKDNNSLELRERRDLSRYLSLLIDQTSVPHDGQRLPGMTHTVAPRAAQVGHLRPGTCSCGKSIVSTSRHLINLSD